MIYVASPYSHPDEALRAHRFYCVQAYCVELMKQGQHPFSPIMYWHEVAVKCDLPLDAGFWPKYNLGMLRIAEAVDVLMLPGWQESKGVMMEINTAEHLFIPVTKIEWRE